MIESKNCKTDNLYLFMVINGFVAQFSKQFI